jgi:hypothetical protein
MADFNVFDDGNYMLVDCDNMSQYSDYQTTTTLGFTIAVIQQLFYVFTLKYHQ